MRIIAFSDYRTQSLEELLKFFRSIEPKPDVILYAGDDIKRFGYPKNALQDALKDYKIRCNYGHNCNEDFCLEEHDSYPYVPNTFFFSIKSVKKKEYNETFIKTKIVKEVLKDGKGVQAYPFDIYGKEGKMLNLSKIIENLNKKCTIYFDKEGKQVYGYIYTYPKAHIFGKLSNFSREGVCAVLGNDDDHTYKEIIQSKKVFNVHDKPFILKDFAIIGLEGASDEIKPVGGIGYSQEEIREHLEHLWSKLRKKYLIRNPRSTLYQTNQEVSKANEKGIILLSHTPPFGVLDFSMRFGERNIGSKALSEFLEDKDVVLNICGHSHLNGGKEEDFEGVRVVNVASHDGFFDPANIAVIDITSYDEIKITWKKIPSNFELFMKNRELKFEEKREKLEEFFRYNSNVDALCDGLKCYGDAFIDDIHKLIKIKILGFSWRHVVEFYKIGVRKQEDITEEIVNKVSNSIRSGLSKMVLKRAYLKLKASKKGEIILRGDLTPLSYPKKVYLDTEYLDICVLYGFLVDNKVKQFIIGEEKEMIEFVNGLIEEDYKFYFYGGSDRKFLTFLNTKEIKNQFINVHYIISTHVGLPIKYYGLSNVLEYLYPEKEKIEWSHDIPHLGHFSGKSILPYDIPGFSKIPLMTNTMRAIEKGIPLDEIDALDFLKKANTTDLEVLKLVTEKLEELIKI